MSQSVTPYNLAKSIATEKSDSANFATPCDALLISAAGNVVVVFDDDFSFTLAVVAGQLVPLKLVRINSTNTTATGLVLWYD